MLGLAGGLVGFGFLRAIGLLLNLTLLHRVGWNLPRLADVHVGWQIFPIAAAGGLVVAVFARWEPLVRGHGIPEAMEAVLAHQSRITVKTAVAKPLSTALAIGSGAPFGAEGPIIVTGGALGSLLGQLVRVSPAERKILLASGAAAGMSAIFGAPFGAVLLAIELLLFEFSTRAFVPLVVASVFADGVHTALIGQGPLFTVPHHDFAGLADLPWYVVLGLAVGVVALVLAKVVYAVEDAYLRLPLPRFWHPVIGAVGFAAIGLAVPRALGVGYDVIGETLAGRLGVGLVAAVFLAKLAAWWVAMGSGTSGSALAPLLLIGASFGSLVGSALGTIAPGASIEPGAFALVGMAALFGAAAGAPFTAIVLVFEMTRDFNVILPLMFATVVAHLLFRAVARENLMTEKLARRGLHVPTAYQADVLRTTRVSEVMQSPVETISAEATVAEARERFSSGIHSAYPLVDGEGRCVAMVGRADMLKRAVEDTQPVLELARSDVVTVRPSATLLDAIDLLVGQEVSHLPVLDDGHLVGMCTQTDVLRARAAEMTREQQQPGWLERRSPGAGRPPPRPGATRD